MAARPIPPEPPRPWLLGTNKKSAAYAARFGTGYAFGQFMSDSSGEESLRAYRDGFVPSPLCPEPRALVAVGVVCADSDEEAERLVSSGMFRRGMADKDKSVTPLNARRLLAGSPGSLRVQLQSLALTYGIDEFIVVTMIADYRARLRSYELLARALSDG